MLIKAIGINQKFCITKTGNDIVDVKVEQFPSVVLGGP